MHDSTSDRTRRKAGARRLCLAVLALAWSLPAAGQDLLCTAPLEPACVVTDIDLSDEMAVNRCRSDVEQFVADAEAYGDCLRKQAEAVPKSIEEIQRVFRCKTGDTEAC